MTTGFGPAAAPSREIQVLRDIDANKKDFVNKDFVRNIAWLNQSVTTLSDFTQLLQKGVDSANQNAVEQIQGFVADLFLVFAGLEPTGIDLGDLKYVLQGIGALLGINPDTPFPLNLVEAVGHLFNTFIVPLPQFTDVIFDAIIAWAEALGFTDAAVDAIQEFDDAVVDLYNDMDYTFGQLGEMFSTLLKGLGLGAGGLDLGPLQAFWNEISTAIQNILSGPRDLLLNMLSQIVVVVFKALTWAVNLINPTNILGATGLKFVGPQLVPEISGSTVDWSVGSNANAGWIFDNTVTHGGSTGSLKTNGNSIGKRVLTQSITPCVEGKTYYLSGWINWNSVPVGIDTFGLCIVFYTDLNEVSQTNANIASGHGTTGGWQQIKQTVVIPPNANGFKVGARVTSAISSGTVWVDEISCTAEQPLGAGLAQGILDFPRNLFNAVSNLVNDLLTALFGIPEVLANLVSAIIPGLDASKIISGQFAQDMVSGLTSILTSLGNGLNTALDNLGGLISDLWNNPGEVISNLLASMIPGLDASKIISGQFAQDMVNGLTTVLTNLGNGVNSALDGLGGLISDLWNNPAAVLQSIGQNLVDGLESALSAINSGFQSLIDAIIHGIRGIPIIGGTIADVLEGAQDLITKLFGGTVPQSTIASAAVPSLDGSKIATGSVAAARIADLDASKITTGTFGTSKIADNAITNAKVNDIDGGKVATGSVAAARIAALDASKISTGTFGTSQIPSLDATKITSGVLGTGIIPALDVSKITTGIFNTSFIPSLDVSKITTGVFSGSFIPSLDASKITTGQFSQSMVNITSITASLVTGVLATGNIPNLPGSIINSGSIGASYIPSLDGSKITSGLIAAARISNLSQSQITDLDSDLLTITQETFIARTETITPARFSLVPATMIADSAQNLILNPTFETADSLSGLTDWTWDNTYSHSATGGAAKNNGYGKYLLSNRIDVVAGSAFNLSVWVKYTGVTATAASSAIRMSVALYDSTGTRTSTAMVTSVSSPSGTQDWVQLTGTYDVPAGSTSYVRIELGVTTAMTAGTVWFDDIAVYKTNSLSDTVTEISEITYSATSAQSSSETLAALSSIPRITSPWVGNLSDESSFAQTLIDGTTAPALGQLILIPVRVTQDRIVDALKFGIAATTMTYCYASLFKIDGSGAGTRIKDLGDIKSQLNTLYNLQTISLGSAIAVARNDLYYIALLQVGGTAAAMHRWSAVTDFTTGLWPRYLGNVHTTGGMSSIPSSFTSANLISGTKYWGALGTAAAAETPGSAFYADSFSASMANWTLRNGTALTVSSGKARIANAYGVMSYNSRLIQAEQEVGATLALVSGTGPGGSTGAAQLGLRGDGLGKSIYLQVNDSSTGGASVSIYTTTTYGGSATQRDTFAFGSGGYQATGDWVFKAAGNTYTGYFNGDQKVQWVDIGGAYVYTNAYTEMLIGASSNTSRAMTIDNWYGKDL